MKRYDIVVVGGGPAGMMAAGYAAAAGCSVLLLEKMEQCGRKLSITGKGRCNLTNTKEWSDFADHIYPLSDFFRPAFWGFSNKALVDFFASIGLETTVERGARLFPACQDARKVTDKLVNWIKAQGVEVCTGARVHGLECIDGRLSSVDYTKQGSAFSVMAGAVVLATGGLSYPATGSTGDGYNLVEAIGHTVSPCFPSLTSLMPKVYDPRLQGLSLTNVRLSLLVNGQTAQEEFGELTFTDLGIEGPLGLRLSRQAVTAIRRGDQVSLVLNLKPALSREQLEARVQREWPLLESESPERFLRRYLPHNLILPFIKASSFSPRDPSNLLRYLQHWEFPIASYGGFERAVVTAGGISLKEIQKKDMRSKVAENLFFAGELIDLDGDTGGYNLQIAFSTGVLAGKKAAELVLHIIQRQRL